MASLQLSSKLKTSYWLRFARQVSLTDTYGQAARLPPKMEKRILPNLSTLARKPIPVICNGDFGGSKHGVSPFGKSSYGPIMEAYPWTSFTNELSCHRSCLTKENSLESLIFELPKPRSDV